MTLLLLLAPPDTEATPDDLELLYKPVRDDVARRLRARLYAQGGRIPTWLNEDQENGPTDPTADEVDKIIDDAAADVAAKVGITLPAEIHPIARRVVALGTALIIETGSEDFDADRYDRLKTEYDEKLANLLDAAQDIATGGDAGDADDRAVPMGHFPLAGHGWDHAPDAEIERDPRRWGARC